MSTPNKQVGWGNEASLLQFITKQLERIGKIVSLQPSNQDTVDTTNSTATTHYYPSATGDEMGVYNHLSISGRLSDTTGVTLTVEVTNDEDTTNANWAQAYGYNIVTNSTVNSIAATTGTTFALQFTNLNFAHYRVKVVNQHATNTTIIKSRKIQ